MDGHSDDFEVTDEGLLVKLNELGTRLRDESIRNDPGTFNLIPKLISLFNDNLDHDPVVFELLRVFINLTADNDKNRLEMIKYKVFWENIMHNLSNERVPILLGQFVKNTECLQEFQSFFYNLKIHIKLIEIMTESNLLVLEFLSEILNPAVFLSDPEFKANALRYLDIFISLYELEESDLDAEDLQEKHSYLSLLMYNITQFDDLDTSLMPRVYPLLNIPNVNSRSNRQLFSTIGNLSSMKNFNDATQVEYAINNVDETTNLYIKAAYYMTIGNYITSADKSQYVNSLLSHSFIVDYFDNKFTDVIQYQSIHMMKNLLNQENCSQVLAHPNLLIYTKVLVDNQNYYQEIFANYKAFIKRLIMVSFPHHSIYDYNQLWDTLDNDEIYMSLASYMDPEGDKALNTKILEKSFTGDLPVESDRILTRLKAQAIILKTIPLVFTHLDDADQFITKFLIQYEKLYEMLTNSNSSNPQYGILLNNSKFVSASLLQLKNDRITTIGEKFLSL